jgi:hypothetical protein
MRVGDPCADLAIPSTRQRRGVEARRSDGPRSRSITMYGRPAEVALGDEAGHMRPASVGRIICSTSKPTIVAGSSPPLMRGTFMISGGVGCPGAVGARTRHSVAMPPR